MSTPKVLLAIGIGLSVIVGGAVLVAALFYVGVHGISSRAPTDAEQRLVLDAEAFGSLADDFDPQCRKLGAKRNLDGSLEIELEYDCEGKADTVYVTSSAEIARHARAASETYAIAIGALKAGVRIGGGALDPQQHLLDLGDQHYAAFVRKGGNVVGNVFVIRQGRVVHSLFLSGAYYEDAESIRNLLAPLVAESKKQYGS